MVKVKSMVLGCAPQHVHEFSLDAKATEVIEAIAKASNQEPQNIVLCYGGKLRPSAEKLSDIQGLKNTSTVFALPKAKDEVKTELSRTRIDSVLSGFQSALHDPTTQFVSSGLKLVNMMENPETILRLCASVTGLRESTEAQAILGDLRLLIQWFRAGDDADYARLSREPLVLEGLEALMSSLHAEVSRMSASGQVVVNPLDDEEGASSGDEAPAPAVPRPPPITPQALAAALAAAVGGAALPPPTQPPSGQGGGSGITASMLQAAMAGAVGGGSGGGGSGSTSGLSSERLESGLGELAEMGFNDSAENRRALQETGGNVEAALELIIQRREAAERAMGLD